MTSNPATGPARCETHWVESFPGGTQIVRRCTRRMDDPLLDAHDPHRWSPGSEDAWVAWTASRAESAATAAGEPLEAKRAELRRYTRTLLGPLYTAADVEGAIDKHLQDELGQVQA